MTQSLEFHDQILDEMKNADSNISTIPESENEEESLQISFKGEEQNTPSSKSPLKRKKRRVTEPNYFISYLINFSLHFVC